jgi:hypothetical protein
MRSERPMSAPRNVAPSRGAASADTPTKDGANMHTIPHRRVSRRDPIREGVKQLVALGLVRWTDEHIGPDDWPDTLPLPIKFEE